MTKATKEAIEFIKQAGFTHVKFELEAQLNRSDGERYCDECGGQGHSECDECSGEGAVEIEEYIGNRYYNNHAECEECNGTGDRECSYCEGRGEESNYRDESECESFLKDSVPADVKERLVYGNFYDDGSVDSEFTFTTHIDHFEDFIHWSNAFKDLAEDIGNGLDISGAGMHITLLQSGNYDNQPRLSTTKMRNFSREVAKLLPALYFVGSAGHQTRGLNYRRPQISSSEKYSAIYTHSNTCIEYRLFETCYQRPEAVFEYIQAIANTLKFFVDTTLTVRSMGKQFGFSDEVGSVARFYSTPEQLRILNATIRLVKPKDKTFKKLKADRGVGYTIKGLTIEEKKKMATMRQEWKQYQEQRRKILDEPLNSEEQRAYDDQILHNDYTPEVARMRIRGLREFYSTFEDFVQHNAPTNNRRSYGDVSITV